MGGDGTGDRDTDQLGGPGGSTGGKPGQEGLGAARTPPAATCCFPSETPRGGLPCSVKWGERKSADKPKQEKNVTHDLITQDSHHGPVDPYSSTFFQ